ncbi:S41 family peptidase [uncultured Proteiniphilum sp.]|uniref:S41 family peptidase n=1 Tax=uncultured Proteiniphilum sp. TaxID=497637 RepID=UPI0026049C69|nr:S41 family peptidase [uncultured Proteiniphilum sp.]
MKKCIFAILISLLAINVSCQKKESNSKYNLGFEDVLNGQLQSWSIPAAPGYSVSLDSVNVQSGKYSILIQAADKSDNFQAISIALPNYAGRQITLSGYVKSENVTDGFAGLWMRIDPQIAFDNMEMSDRGIRGTTDWKRYEITLPMTPAKTERIVVGGLLSGKGKIWLDNLSITIDGKDISQAKIFELPANLDREFDNGSNIEFPTLTEQIVDNLNLLGKLWGFLKYHHPEVGKGNYNWDFELFRILPNYLKVQNNTERDHVILDWINQYGEIPVCTACEKTLEDAYIKPDFSWIENSDMSNELKKKIWEIYENRHQGNHFYIQMRPRVDNLQFLNENPYSDMFFPDAGFRLLTLYRYWNMIHYFFPYKYVTDNDWNDVLRKYIPIFLSVQDRLEYELTAIQLIGEANDTHANLWGGRDEVEHLRGNYNAPFRVQFVEQKLVVTDYFNPELKSLGIGDIITHIDGKTVEAIVDSLKRYYPASNKASLLRDISVDMLRSRSHSINIRYISSGRTHEKELPLYPRDRLNFFWYRVNEDEKSYKLLDGNIGYVTLANIKDEDFPIIKDLFKNTRGIIIDIRNYPSAFTPFTLASFFVSEPTPFVKFTRGNVNNPGEFMFDSAYEVPKSDDTYQGKLIVIVNEITQSSAEYQSMAFRAGNNTTIIGSQTAGADGNVSDIMLPGGLLTKISGIGVYYPDGRQTQRIGIVPDIEVKPTIQGIKEGRDELLEKAIEIIERQ